jgi:hypothetical protein
VITVMWNSSGLLLSGHCSSALSTVIVTVSVEVEQRTKKRVLGAGLHATSALPEIQPAAALRGNVRALG